MWNPQNVSLRPAGFLCTPSVSFPPPAVFLRVGSFSGSQQRKYRESFRQSTNNVPFEFLLPPFNWRVCANSPQPGNANANVTFDQNYTPQVTFAFAFPGLRAVCYPPHTHTHYSPDILTTPLPLSLVTHKLVICGWSKCLDSNRDDCFDCLTSYSVFLSSCLCLFPNCLDPLAALLSTFVQTPGRKQGRLFWLSHILFSYNSARVQVFAFSPLSWSALLSTFVQTPGRKTGAIVFTFLSLEELTRLSSYLSWFWVCSSFCFSPLSWYCLLPAVSTGTLLQAFHLSMFPKNSLVFHLIHVKIQLGVESLWIISSVLLLTRWLCCVAVWCSLNWSCAVSCCAGVPAASWSDCSETTFLCWWKNPAIHPDWTRAHHLQN